MVWGQAAEERFSEITSGTSLWQQGLIATCKGSSNEAKAEGEESQVGWTHEPVRAMTEEQCPRRRRKHVSLIQVMPALGKGALDLGGSIGSEAFGHSAELSRAHEVELGPGQTTEVGAYANQRLNLAKLGRPRAEMPRFRTGPWEIRPSGIIGGPPETWPWWK